MGLQNKSNMTLNTLLTVLDFSKDNYIISDRVTKMASDDDSLLNYDENISTTENTEIKNHLPQRKQTVNKFTGNVINTEKVNPVDFPMDIFDDYIIQHTFLFIPAGKKAGDSWLVKDPLRECNYTLVSTTGDTATVFFEEKFSQTKTFDVQGMQVTSHTNNISTGQIILNYKRGLVKTRKANTTSIGTVDLMGQLSDVRTKNKSVSTFYY